MTTFFKELQQKDELFPTLLKISSDLHQFIDEQRRNLQIQDVDVELIFDVKNRQKWQKDKYNPMFFEPQAPEEQNLTFKPILEIIIKYLKFVLQQTQENVQENVFSEKQREIIERLSVDNFYINQKEVNLLMQEQTHQEKELFWYDQQFVYQMRIFRIFVLILFLQVLYLIIFDYYYHFKERIYVESLEKQLLITRFLDDLDVYIKEQFKKQQSVFSRERRFLNFYQYLFQEKYQLFKFNKDDPDEQRKQEYFKQQLLNLLYLLRLLQVLGQFFGQIRRSYEWFQKLQDLIDEFENTDEFVIDIRTLFALTDQSKQLFYKYSNIANLLKNNLTPSAQSIQQDEILSQMILDLSSRIGVDTHVIIDTIPFEEQYVNEIKEIGQWTNFLTDDQGIPPNGKMEIVLKQTDPNITEFTINRMYFIFDPFRDENQPEYQVDFKIEFFNEQNELLYVDEIQNNTRQQLVREYSPEIMNVNKIKITITKWNRQSSQIKIYRIVPGISNTLQFIRLQQIYRRLIRNNFILRITSLSEKQLDFQQIADKLYYLIKNLLFLQMIPDLYFLKHNACSFLLDDIQVSFLQRFFNAREVYFLRCFYVNQSEMYLKQLEDNFINILRKRQNLVERYIAYFIFSFYQIEENIWGDFLKDVIKLGAEYVMSEFKKEIVQILQHIQQQLFTLTQENRFQQNITNIFEQPVSFTQKMQRSIYGADIQYLLFKDDVDKYNLYQLVRYQQFKGSRIIISRIINMIQQLKNTKGVFISDYNIPYARSLSKLKDYTPRYKTTLISDDISLGLSTRKFQQIYPPYIKFQNILDLTQYKELQKELLESDIQYQKQFNVGIQSEFNKYDRRGYIIQHLQTVLYYRGRSISGIIQKDLKILQRMLQEMLPIWLNFEFVYDYIYQPQSKSDLISVVSYIKQIIEIYQRFIQKSLIAVFTQRETKNDILQTLYKLFLYILEGIFEFQTIIQVYIINSCWFENNVDQFQTIDMSSVNIEQTLMT